MVRRLLQGLASTPAMLCCAGMSVAQQPPASYVDSLCETGTIERLYLKAAERVHCQALWRQRIEDARERAKQQNRLTMEENRQRRVLEASLPPPPAHPVTVETFIDAGSLSYGDVVVTDRGPRVFIGKPLEAATPEDFVAIDSPRSPHRARATQFDGAFPERKVARPTTPRRERQP